MACVYAPGPAGENAEAFLTGFDGVLQIDVYTGYNRLTKPSRKGGAPIRVAQCWAHARRQRKEVFDRDGSESVAEGLRCIADIYAVEGRYPWRLARPAPVCPQEPQRLAGRGLRRMAAGRAPQGLSQIRLGEKLTYIQNHGDGLQIFLTEGLVEIDNNRVINLIRPIALNHKNAPFAGHDEGDIAWGRIASLIETCKINGVEPFAYLKATLTADANSPPQSRLDDMLHWNSKPSS